MSDPSAPVREGEVLAGKYRVERVIGSGGMGVVVAARHLKLGERVALKFLLPRFPQSEDTVARFEREAKAMFRLKSAHVGRVLDVGVLESGAPYMVMEYLDGCDLAALLVQEKRLSVADAVGYVLQACDGIGDAHAQGIIHRDIKPQNLFLTEGVDGSGHVKVLDFGISKLGAADDVLSLTSSATIMGSPFYMSPEQLRSSRSADARSDIWALGVVLFELLTGALPFSAESAPALYAKLLVEDAPSPCLLRPDLPVALERAILCCLKRDPEDRFQTVAALAEALEPFAPSNMAGIARRIAAVRPRPSSPSPLATSIGPTRNGIRTDPNWEDTSPTQRSKRRALTLSVIAAIAIAGVFVLPMVLRRPTAETTSPPKDVPAATPTTVESIPVAIVSSTAATPDASVPVVTKPVSRPRGGPARPAPTVDMMKRRTL